MRSRVSCSPGFVSRITWTAGDVRIQSRHGYCHLVVRARPAEPLTAHRLPSKIVATVVAAAVGTSASACGDDQTRSSHAAKRLSTVAASDGDDNVGTGRLRNNRFAVDPVVLLYICHEGPRECPLAGYAIFARLTRDIPLWSSGKLVAAFEVRGLQKGATSPPRGDPPGRQGKRHRCFQDGVATDHPKDHRIPTTVGARVRVTLKAYDRRGKTTGTLWTVVRLSPPEPPRAPNDYSPSAAERAIGCA
jgi:hypothetical protein